MATISRGITLSYNLAGLDQDTLLTNLMEIPELGGSFDTVEITTLADAAHVYTKGLENYGDSLDFKFLYEAAQFETLNGFKERIWVNWAVTLPDGEKCRFTGPCSVKLDGVGTNAALTYTLSIVPQSAMTWESK